MSPETVLMGKVALLLKHLAGYRDPLVMFSGGVDSTVLAAAVKRAGSGRAALFTVLSPTMPQSEVEEARELAANLGMEQVEFSADETVLPEFAANDKERCYYCKKYRLTMISAWAKQNAFSWLLEGSNADDALDYRPGMKALAEYSKVISPLKEAGLTKSDIREIARIWGLAVWDKPAAACLASRLAYGLSITKERLREVEEAEKIIAGYCPAGSMRVRHHGDLARIEVEAKHLPILADPKTAGEVAEKLKKLGFTFVALDMQGYSMGSMNKLLADGRGV